MAEINITYRHPLYAIWCEMKQRCKNKNHKCFHRYGGRGIKICDRWNKDFKNFIEDMFPTYKAGLSIDRINNDSNYELSNCRWATAKEQANNKTLKIKTNMQKESITQMIVALKAIKIPVSKIEADLKFSNGLIGKAAKGTTELSEQKLNEFKVYFNNKVGSEIGTVFTEKEAPNLESEFKTTNKLLLEKISEQEAEIKHLKQQLAKVNTQPPVKLNDLTNKPLKSNFTINTEQVQKPLSIQAQEIRNKKLGLKPEASK